MDENSRRSLRELIARALDKDTLAIAAIEELIVGFGAPEAPSISGRRASARPFAQL